MLVTLSHFFVIEIFDCELVYLLSLLQNTMAATSTAIYADYASFVILNISWFGCVALLQILNDYLATKPITYRTSLDTSSMDCNRITMILMSVLCLVSWIVTWTDGVGMKVAFVLYFAFFVSCELYIINHLVNLWQRFIYVFYSVHVQEFLDETMTFTIRMIKLGLLIASVTMDYFFNKGTSTFVQTVTNSKDKISTPINAGLGFVTLIICLLITFVFVQIRIEILQKEERKVLKIDRKSYRLGLIVGLITGCIWIATYATAGFSFEISLKILMIDLTLVTIGILIPFGTIARTPKLMDELNWKKYFQ